MIDTNDNTQSQPDERLAAVAAGATGSAALSRAIFQVIVDELGGIEASHSYMGGMCAAIHARVMITLHENGVLQPPNIASETRRAFPEQHDKR